MISLTEREIVAALISIFSISLSIWAWTLRRWVSKVDQLHKDVAALAVTAAVRDERMTHLVGALEVLRKTVQDQAASIGVLKMTVDKMWIILEAKGLVEARYSDGELSAVRRKP